MAFNNKAWKSERTNVTTWCRLHTNTDMVNKINLFIHNMGAQMPLIRWEESYSVHEPLLDSHHQRLFSMLNELYERVVNSSSLDCILPVLDEFYDYTTYHFSAEEEHMRVLGFTDTAEHIEQHQEFIRALDSLRLRYHDNDLDVARELLIILGEWLLHHVMKVDKKFTEN